MRQTAPRPTTPRAGNQCEQETTRACGEKKKKEKKGRQTHQQERATSAWRGRSKARGQNCQRKGEAHQNARGRPARPTQPRRACTRTNARDPGMAPSDPQGEVLASTRISPGARTDSLVARRKVPETGRVSNRVHTRQPPQRRQPKTDAGDTRQGHSHRQAPNGYDAERAQRPCLGGGQRQEL